MRKMKELRTMDNYSFNVFWSDGDEAYIAICPEFPRLSAFGDTPEVALAEMQIVLEMAIETYHEEGWPLPKPLPYREHIEQPHLWLPRDLHAKLAAQAEAEGVSLNKLVEARLANSFSANNALSG